MLQRLKQEVDRLLWHPRLPARRAPLRWVTRLARFPYALLRDAIEGQLNLRAMSLVYTTLLSLVPLIALSFSVLKGFGVHDQIEPILNNLLTPLGPQGTELTDNILGYVDNVKGAALGSVGLVLLIYTVVSMVQKVEESFNFVWQVNSPRSIGRRFSEYLSVIVFAPLLMVSAAAIAGSISSNILVQKLLVQPLGSTLVDLGRIVPYLLVTLAFTFVYGFIPNTKVKVSAAFVGGVTAGALWGTVGALFASFVASSANYKAIYSGFAVAMVGLIWLYISWLILLLGAKVAFYFQHPEYLRRGKQQVAMTNQLRERSALVVMQLVAEDFRRGDGNWKLNDLAKWMGLPGLSLAPIVKQLEKSGLLLATEQEVFVPGRDPAEISVADILAAIRGSREPEPHSELRATAQVDTLMKGVDEAIAGFTADCSLRELVDRGSVVGVLASESQKNRA